MIWLALLNAIMCGANCTLAIGHTAAGSPRRAAFSGAVAALNAAVAVTAVIA